MVDVVMPKMGESIIEGTILEWKKSIGDTIGKDETLLEISTDKVDSEIPSPASGTIVEIIAQVNDTVPVGDVIARIGDRIEENVEKSELESIGKSQAEETNSEKSHSLSPPLVKSKNSSDIPNIVSGKRFYSPLVKSMVKAENISLSDLDSIVGSGKNGRISKKDILIFLANRLKGTAPKDHVVSPVQSPETAIILDNIEPMSRMRKKIAEHMVQSVKISPHVYTTVEADVSNLVDIRLKHKDEFKQRTGVSLTYTPMLLNACICTIQEFPLMNASLDGDNIIHHQNINMGVAVALPDDNLIVPVIQSSEEKNFLGLIRSTADLANRARGNKLHPDEIFGSTFTVTNPGVFGGLFGMGIINQPNVGILAVGSFQKRPVVKETEYGDTIVIRHMVYLTLSYDHRIIDGSYGTRFLARLVKNIESFNESKIQS